MPTSLAKVFLLLSSAIVSISANQEDFCFAEGCKPGQNGSNVDLLVFTVATDRTEGYERFLLSAQRENLTVETLGLDEQWRGGDVVHTVGGGQKVNLLKAAMENYKDRSDLLIMFVDSYDVIFLSGKSEIVKKFLAFESNAVFSAEGFCWPDASLKSLYPDSGDGKQFLNSGGFIGYAPELYKIVTHTAINDSDDDQLFYTKIYLDQELRTSLRIRLDNRASIFQNLNGAVGDVSLTNDVYPRVQNTAYGTSPAVIHGNGPSKIALNSLSNYVAGAWKTGEGCQICEDRKDYADDANLPTVCAGLFVTEVTAFFDDFLKHFAAQDYPKKKISVYIHQAIEYHKDHVDTFAERNSDLYAKFERDASHALDEWLARENALKFALDNGCDFFLNVDARVHLTNVKTLRHLVAKDRKFISPMVLRSGQAWSNFWGSLTSDGFYARSHDYMEIVRGDKRGLWNVPHVGDVYLMKTTVIRESSPTYVNGDLDPDMSFCKTLREKGIFMYLDNLEDFGFLINSEKFDPKRVHPNFYEIFHNQKAWERKYIHEDYGKIFKNESANLLQPCTDVYWFPIASPAFCQSLIDIMEKKNTWSDGTNSDPRLTGGYENVPTRDIHLKQVGLEAQWLYFLREYVRPVQELVYTGYHHDPPRAIMNFVVRYRPDEQPNLRPHHDASTFTINLALNQVGEDFEGGGSRFIRYNCSVTSSPRGWALLHPGRLTHYHEGLTTTKGTRYIMVSFVDP